MWRIVLSWKDGTTEEYLVEDGITLNKFLDVHIGLKSSIKWVSKWTPEIPKEPLTKKEKTEQPKEPIPLSRFEGEE